MPWIQVIEEADADEALQKAYQKVNGDRGKTANILKIHSLLPDTMTAHLDFYMKVMFADGSLSRKQRELIAIVVSAANNCPYCINHHAEALNAYIRDRDLVNQLVKDFTKVDLDPKERAMCNFAVKLTKTPNVMTEADTIALRQADIDDKDILHITLVIGYFNFVNRIALGLDVPFNEEEVKGYKF